MTGNRGTIPVITGFQTRRVLVGFNEPPGGVFFSAKKDGRHTLVDVSEIRRKPVWDV